MFSVWFHFGYCLCQLSLLYVLIKIFLCWSHECSSIYIVCKIATAPPFLRHPPFAPFPSLLFSFRQSPHHHISCPNLAHQFSLHIHTGTFFLKAYVLSYEKCFLFHLKTFLSWDIQIFVNLSFYILYLSLFFSPVSNCFGGVHSRKILEFMMSSTV